MPISRFLVLALSLTTGGGAAWLTTMNEPQSSQMIMTAPAVPSERAEVLIARTDLMPRQRIEAGDLEWKPWPKDAVHAGFILRSSEPDALDGTNGKLVQTAMLAGEPLRREKISASSNGYLSALLSPGKRAVSVKITSESTAGGFILPDDRVDVLHTTVTGTGRTGFTRTVVTNIRVLAIDQQTSAPTTNAVTAAKTATLELGPEQVEVVSAAEANGTLSLSLRSAADNSDIQVIASESEHIVHIISSGNGRLAKIN